MKENKVRIKTLMVKVSDLENTNLALNQKFPSERDECQGRRNAKIVGTIKSPAKRISKINLIWKLLYIGNFLRRKKIVLVSSLFLHKSLQNPALICIVLCLDFLICNCSTPSPTICIVSFYLNSITYQLSTFQHIILLCVKFSFLLCNINCL